MANASSSEGIAAYIDRVTAELQRHAPRALGRGRRSSVHKARVATRRLTAAIEILEPLLKDGDRKAVLRSLKKIRRSVRDLRDLDVMQEHLLRYASNRAARQFRQQLSVERRDTFRRVHADAKTDSWLKSAGRSEEFGRVAAKKDPRARKLLLKSISSQARDFIAEADRLSRARLDGRDGRLNPHRLRIAGKSLRYTLEIAQAEGLGVANRLLETFKALQDDLGDWHDDYVLSLRIADQGVRYMQKEGYLQDGDALLDLAALVVRDSRTRLRRFARAWRKGRAATVKGLESLDSPRRGGSKS